MHAFIIFFVGAVIALAIKRKNGCDDLKYWRPLAGGTAAAFPHLEQVVLPFGLQTVEHGIFWSPLLAPIFALGVSFAAGYFSKQKWQRFYLPSLVAAFAGILLGFCTAVGIKPLSPFLDYKISWGIIYHADFKILAISIVGLVLCYLLKRWQRDIARIAVLLIAAYVVTLTTFSMKAESFAKNYIKASGIKVSRVYTLPQPVSPLNWRIIIVDDNDKLHDNRINLSRDEEKIGKETDNRSERISALYKPMNTATWNIYRKFGNKNAGLAKSLWNESLGKSPHFNFKYRFAVYRKMQEHEGMNCVMFKDIRKLKSRYNKANNVLLCQSEGRVLTFISDKNGKYKPF